jgi:hypothetical protein
MVGYITIGFRHASLVAGVSLSDLSNRSHDWFLWVYAMVAKIIYIIVLPYIIVWRVFAGMVDLVLGLVGMSNQSDDKDRPRQRGLGDAGSQPFNKQLSCKVTINGQQTIPRSPHPKTPETRIEPPNNKSNATPNSKSATVAKQYQESLVPKKCCDQESRFGSVNMFEVLGDMEEDTDAPQSTAARKILDDATTLLPTREESESSSNSKVNTRGSSRKWAKRRRRAIAALFHHPASETAVLQQTSAQSLLDPFLSSPVDASSKSNQASASSRSKPLCRLPRLSRATNGPSIVKRQPNSDSAESRQKQFESVFTSDGPPDHRSQINHDNPTVAGTNAMPTSRNSSVSDDLIIFTTPPPSEEPITLREADLSTQSWNPDELQMSLGSFSDGGRASEVLASFPNPIVIGETDFGHSINEHEGPAIDRLDRGDRSKTAYTSYLSHGSSKSTLEEKTNVRLPVDLCKLVQRERGLVGSSSGISAAVHLQGKDSHSDEHRTTQSGSLDIENSHEGPLPVNIKATEQVPNTSSISQHLIRTRQHEFIEEARQIVRRTQMTKGSVGSPVPPASPQSRIPQQASAQNVSRRRFVPNTAQLQHQPSSSGVVSNHSLTNLDTSAPASQSLAYKSPGVRPSRPHFKAYMEEDWSQNYKL